MSIAKLDLKGFDTFEKDFQKIVNSIQEETQENRVWLTGIGKLVESKVNAKVTVDDLNWFAKKIEGDTVLDFGTGSGNIAALLSQMGYKVSALDIDSYEEYEKSDYNKEMTEDQLKLWRKLEQRYNNLNLQHYDDQIPFEDNHFDAIVAYAVLEHVPENLMGNVMNELHRVLKPGGVLCISRLPRTLSYTEFMSRLLGVAAHEKLYTMKEIITLFKKYKFDIADKSIIELVPAYPTKITNKLFPIFKYLDGLLLITPLRYLAHHIRLIGKKI